MSVRCKKAAVISFLPDMRSYITRGRNPDAKDEFFPVPQRRTVPAKHIPSVYSITIMRCLVSVGNNPVVRRVYELEHPGSSSSSPRLWRYRVRVCIDHLRHILEQNMTSCGPNQCQLLREFLKQVLCYN